MIEYGYIDPGVRAKQVLQPVILIYALCTAGPVFYPAENAGNGRNIIGEDTHVKGI